jgi:hypothetical protein
MKIVVVLMFLVVGAAAAVYFCRRATVRRERERTLAHLASLPPVKTDFSTPEGAILCLENTYLRKDLETAVACRDFVTEAKLWLQEQGGLSEQVQVEMLPELTKTMEKSFRESRAKQWPFGWDQAKSYFVKREPYGQGLVAISETTILSDGSVYDQCILTSETSNGWRVVTPLVKSSDGWRVVSPPNK